MTEHLVVPPLFGVVGLICAFIIYRLVKRYPPGSAAIQKIGDAIHNGAMVFMHREYRYLGIFAAVLIVFLFFTPGLGPNTALAFFVGAVSSALAGYIGMYTATQANVRTTTAAHDHGAPEALTVAFFPDSASTSQP